MDEPRAPLFRPTALAHYAERRERTVLPRLTGNRVFLLLWAALALLGMLAGLVLAPLLGELGGR
jgi:hypothetical protein